MTGKNGRKPNRLPKPANRKRPRVNKIRLPDKIPSNVHTVFVGINPGRRSATIGHYYAGHSNSFWKLLNASGIWPSQLNTYDDDKIVEAGFGLTDVVKRPTRGVRQLRDSDFNGSRPRIRRMARRFRPKTIVFVGKTAAQAYLKASGDVISYGLQDWRVGKSKVFILPSTSGASLGHTSYPQKLKYFRRLKTHLGDLGIQT